MNMTGFSGQDAREACVYAALADLEQGSRMGDRRGRSAAVGLNEAHAISMPLTVQNQECGFSNFTLLSTSTTRHVDIDVDRALVVDFISKFENRYGSYAKNLLNKIRRLAVSTRNDVDTPFRNFFFFTPKKRQNGVDM